ncbi:MAG: hypothetical protein HYT08_00695 [Candidatus Levybacteria bacterium]|nr:hypothetical protein [Candidatus Levybacteria bacterium]
MEEFLKRRRSIFIAYPWDMLVKSMYSSVIETLSKDWDIRHGSEITKANKDSSQREKFLNRNKQLYDKFVDGIQKSDIFIADVTNANPNVMVELGIAIQLNKNVIILTSQDPSKLPFDIKGFEVDKYSNQEEVLSLINKHLLMFLKIKNQDFDNYIDECYTRVDRLEFSHGNNLLQVKLPEKIKNLRLRVEYKIIYASDPLDWIGFHLRASDPGPSFSELVYVRENKNLESVTMGIRSTPVVGVSKQNVISENKDGFTKLELILEENRLFAITSEKELSDDSAQLESFGSLWIQANAHHLERAEKEKLNIELRNLEIINLDTISEIT